MADLVYPLLGVSRPFCPNHPGRIISLRPQPNPPPFRLMMANIMDSAMTQTPFDQPDNSMEFSTLNTKRQRSSSTSSGSDAELQSSKIVRKDSPRFLLISSTDADLPLGQCHAVAVEKSIAGCIGSNDFFVTRLRNGNLLVEVSKDSHSRSLMKLNKMICSNTTYPVRVEPHRSLNSSRGVVKCNEFKLFEETEIEPILASQGVTHAKRMNYKKDNKVFPSGTVILTFNTPSLPKKIKLGFMVIGVEPFIPNPMRCFNCQRFGHTANRCKHSQVCSVCAEKGHDDRSCGNPRHCANCEGDHPAFSRDCPLWRQEKSVQEIKVQRGLSYFEAKKAVLGNAGIPTYASQIKKQPSTKTMSTQTDPEHTKCICSCKSQTNCFPATNSTIVMSAASERNTVPASPVSTATLSKGMEIVQSTPAAQIQLPPAQTPKTAQRSSTPTSQRHHINHNTPAISRNAPPQSKTAAKDQQKSKIPPSKKEKLPNK